MALAGISAGVGAGIGQTGLGGTGAAGAAVTGSARAIANAATRSLIEGTDFGDNLIASLPDVIGQTIGEAIAGGISDSLIKGGKIAEGEIIKQQKLDLAAAQRSSSGGSFDITNSGEMFFVNQGDTVAGGRRTQIEPSEFTIGDVQFVVFPEGTELVPVVRQETEEFTLTASRALEELNLDTVVNGPQFTLTQLARAGAVLGQTQSPEVSTTDGLVIEDGIVLDGRSSEYTFFLSGNESRDGTFIWDFGFGNPPIDSSVAFGGAIPLVINGLKFGDGNLYYPTYGVTNPNVPIATQGPLTGDPGDFEPFLFQRNNSGFAAWVSNPLSTGKTAVGFNPDTGEFMLAVQEHGSTNGMSIVDLREEFYKRGFTNALLFDGSDSSMITNQRGLFIPPGSIKNDIIEVGIGFRLNGSNDDDG